VVAVVAYSVLLTYICSSMSIASYSCYKSQEAGYSLNAWIAMYMFSFLGVIFLGTGARMIYKTKRKFKLFYNEYKC